MTRRNDTIKLSSAPTHDECVGESAAVRNRAKDGNRKVGVT